MNKIFVIISLMFLFSSCSVDENDFGIIENNINYAKVEQIMQMKDQVQRIAYGTLTAAERYYLWNSRLNEIKGTKLNNSQTALLNKIQNQLTLAYFSNSINKEGADPIFFELKNQVIQDFGFELSKIYFTTLNRIDLVNLNKNDETLDPGSGGGPTPCECSVSDDWCVWGSSCFAGFCSQSNSGCGWWLEEPCIGRCASNP